MHFILFLFITFIKSDINQKIEDGPTDSLTYCQHSEIAGNEITIAKTADGIAPTRYGFCQNLQNKKFTVKIDVLGEYFFYRSNVETVTLTSDVKTIGKGAFAFCPFLKLTIPAGNTFDAIVEGAFYKSTLSPSSQINSLIITTLGQHAFYDCTLPTLTVTLGNDVPESAFEHCRTSSNGKLSVQFDRGTGNSKTFSIGESAFAYSSIETFDIADYITSIGRYAFQFSSLKNFVFKSKAYIPYNAFYNCAFEKGITIPSTVSSIGNYAFGNCVTSSVKIDGYPSISGTTIGENAFYRCSMSKLSFGEYRSNFQSTSFSKCQSITELTFGNITEIPENAFQEDLITGSIDLTFPATLLTINSGAFMHCTSIRSVTFDANSRIAEIAPFLFYECTNLQSVNNIPNTVKSIGGRVPGINQNQGASFWNCINLENIALPKYLEAIYDHSFINCKKLKSVDFPITLTTIAEGAFESCSQLVITNGIYSKNSIGDRAFYGCSSLSGEIQILRGTIGDEVFYGCSGITKLFLNVDIDTIPKKAFYGCSSLIEVNATGVINTINEQAFYGCSQLTRCSFSPSVTHIAKQAFYGCSNLIGTFPFYVDTISEQAFYGCSNLIGPLPLTVSTLESEAFHGCSSLTGQIPNSISSQKLPKGVFYGCAQLTGEIPQGLTIESYALYGCSGLTGPIPNTARFEEYAFYGCSGLTGPLHFERNVVIGDFAFYGCSGLTGEFDASELTAIGKYAFAGCSRLTGPLHFERNVVIGDFAFQGCSGLSNSLSFDIAVSSSSTPTKIGRNAFQDCNGFKDGTLSFVVNDKEDTITNTGSYYKFDYFLQICNNAFDNTKFKDVYYLGRFEPDCDYDIGLRKIQGIHTSTHYINKSFCNHPLHSDDLSAGAIAGIVIACIVVVAAIAVLVVFLILRRRKNKPQSEEEYEMNQDP